MRIRRLRAANLVRETAQVLAKLAPIGLACAACVLLYVYVADDYFSFTRPVAVLLPFVAMSGPLGAASIRARWSLPILGSGRGLAAAFAFAWAGSFFGLLAVFLDFTEWLGMGVQGYVVTCLVFGGLGCVVSLFRINLGLRSQ